MDKHLLYTTIKTNTMAFNIKNVDLILLKKQKDILIRMIQDWGESSDDDQQLEAKEVEGLLYLLDEIQDELE